jgi:hypothetical protein
MNGVAQFENGVNPRHIKPTAWECQRSIKRSTLPNSDIETAKVRVNSLLFPVRRQKIPCRLRKNSLRRASNYARNPDITMVCRHTAQKFSLRTGNLA